MWIRNKEFEQTKENKRLYVDIDNAGSVVGESVGVGTVGHVVATGGVGVVGLLCWLVFINV